MRMLTMQQLGTAVVTSCLLAGSASAKIAIEDFNNRVPDAVYGSWGDPGAVLTPGTDSLNVTTPGVFGGGYFGLGTAIDASAEVDDDGRLTFELDITVNSNADPEAGIGPIVVLEDNDGTRWRWAWFGTQPGNSILTGVIDNADPDGSLGGPGNAVAEEAPGTVFGMDFSAIQNLHIQVDPGFNAGFDIDLNDLSFVNPQAAIPGDLNGDGYVGLDDLQPILDHWNQNVTVGDASMGDIAGPSGGAPDGYVGLDDLQPVLDHWNEGTLPTPSTVPEPASLALLGIGGLAVLRRR